MAKLSVKPAVKRFTAALIIELNLILFYKARSSMFTQMDKNFPPLSFISLMLNIIPIKEVKIKIELHYKTAV